MGVSAVVRVDGLFESAAERDALVSGLAALKDAPIVKVLASPQGECIEVYVGVNFYEPGGGRGHWPRARAVIDVATAALPGRDVYYGHELQAWSPTSSAVFPDPLGILVTPTMLTEHDEGWAQYQRERDADEKCYASLLAER